MNTKSSKEKSVVAYFMFNRPEAVRQSLAALRRHEPDIIYVFGDGPRPSVAGESERVDQARGEFAKIPWNCEVFYYFRDSNVGLRTSIMEGLDIVFSRHDFASVVEDDCVISSDFFRFAEEIRHDFANIPWAGIVSATSYESNRHVRETYRLSSQPSIWGWATWARVWKAFRQGPQLEEWNDHEIDEVVATCCTPTQARRWAVDMRRAKSLNTWDISFGVFMRKNRLLTIVPRVNLTENVGFGLEATHTKVEPLGLLDNPGTLSFPITHPPSPGVDCDLERLIEWDQRKRMVTFFFKHPKTSLVRIWNFFQLTAAKLFSRH